MTNDEVIAAVSKGLRTCDPIRALFLSGSHGYGAADAESDVDFQLVVRDGAEAEAVAAFRHTIEAAEHIVLWRTRAAGSTVINVVTSGWRRCDAEVVTSGALGARYQDAHRPLFDRDGLYGGLAATTPPSRPNAAQLKWQIEEFVRVLGLLVVVVKREDYQNALGGVAHLRNLLVALLVDEGQHVHKGGALHLKRLLSPEQADALASLPVVAHERESVIRAHLAYADLYLPRAMRLADDVGVPWPQAFIDATWSYLERELSIRRG